MTRVFLDSPQTGLLTYLNIYEFYDEPRFFSVEDRVGNLYVVYWMAETEDTDSWYIIPISKNKLQRLETRQVCIRDILLYQEESYFKEVTIPFDEDDAHLFNVEYVKSSDINSRIKIPKQGLYISNAPEECAEEEFISASATHEIHIQKTSKKSKSLVLEQVSRIYESFGNLYNSIADAFDIESEIQPISGRYGSFILSFNAHQISDIEPTLIGLLELIDKDQDIKEYVLEKQIDTKELGGFLDEISNSYTNFELKRNDDAQTIFEIDAATAKKCLGQIKSLSSTKVSSSQVPQANDIDKLFEIVDTVARNELLATDVLKLTPRQIKYYIHAAYTLGYLTRYGSLTALGEQVSVSEYETKMKMSAHSFQNSTCGWAWIRWAGVSNISELDANSAVDFLLTQCSSLSDTTSKRRATTLRKWCSEFSQFYTAL